MVNTKLLMQTIEDSGISISKVCKKAGILRNTFYRKLENPNTFKVNEVESIKNVLNLSNAERDRIFFAKNVE